MNLQVTVIFMTWISSSRSRGTGGQRRELPFTLVEFFFYLSLQIIFKKKIKSFVGLSNFKYFLSKRVRASPLWPSAPWNFYSSRVSCKSWDYLGHSGLWVIFWGLSQPLVSCATGDCPGHGCQPSFSVFIVL